MPEDKLTADAKRIFNFLVNQNEEKIEVESSSLEISLRHKKSGCFSPSCGHLGMELLHMEKLGFYRKDGNIEITSYVNISIEMTKLQASINKYPELMSSGYLNLEENSLGTPSEYQTGVWIDIVDGIFKGFSLVIYA